MIMLSAHTDNASEPSSTTISVRQLRVAIAGLVVMVIVGAGNIYFSYQNYKQKLELENERREFEKKAAMTRQMLNARAKIQIALVDSLKRNNLLTPDELTMVNRLWDKAEYNLIEEK